MKNKMKKVLIFVLIVTVFIIPKVFATEIVNNISGNATMLEDVTMGANAVPFDPVVDTGRDVSGPISPINIIIAKGITIARHACTIISIIFAILAVKSFITKDPEKPKKHIVKGTTYTLGAIGAFCAGSVLSIIKSFKPVIYLYPEDEEEVTVKLGKKEKLTCTYPKYNDGWKVLAEPSGDLIDLETGKELYSLYWEGKNDVKHDLTEGFIVEGKDAASFLEEKLEILGLNPKEKQEFIIYWLPELESNGLNFIRFETKEQIDEDMPLEVIPKPDTVIRIMMVVKKINKSFEVKEQVLTKAERKGFTVVEWGGTRI